MDSPLGHAAPRENQRWTPQSRHLKEPMQDTRPLVSRHRITSHPVAAQAGAPGVTALMHLGSFLATFLMVTNVAQKDLKGPDIKGIIVFSPFAAQAAQ